MKNFSITTAPIDVYAVQQQVMHPNAGAVTLFIGTVREMTYGKQTLQLTYEAYIPMALRMFQQIEQEVLARWPDVKLAITHRIGTLAIADIAVVIAVASPHREASYRANEYTIERLKQIVPIWKKEYWTDGSAWIGDQLENIPYGDFTKKEEQQ